MALQSSKRGEEEAPGGRLVGEGEEKWAALFTNAHAVRVVAAAVESTLGPKGLDTMLVDSNGEVVVTNDGVTILRLMEANHPAARLLIRLAQVQQEEVGDGTTTATLLASALVSEGVNQILRGVPPAQVIEGIKLGSARALELLRQKARAIEGLNDAWLQRVALVAGRSHADLAELVVEGALLAGEEKLRDPSFRLADMIVAREGAAGEVFCGVVINQDRVNLQMPRRVAPACVLIIDDALEPETIPAEAMATDAGFAYQQRLREEFYNSLSKLTRAGVNVVLINRGLDEGVEEFLCEAGILAVQRAAFKELCLAAELTGARLVKRTVLRKSEEELAACLGRAEEVYADERRGQVRVVGGRGRGVATVIVGAATREVVGERERMAKDAAAAVQAAVRGGIVPGGGAVELAVARELSRQQKGVKGMASYGVECVIEALKRPLAQIVQNAGFNPLEKVGQVISAQEENNSDSLGIDCDSGEVADMWDLGVVDPWLVKSHALKTATEVAEAILRINTIIKKKENISVYDDMGRW